MNSIAYAAVPDAAKVALFALAARFNGHNNGNLSLTFAEAKKLGVAYQWKLYAGLQLLKMTELVLCTRQGLVARGTKICSLYALTWREIHEAPSNVYYDAGITSGPFPRHAWSKWEKPPDWRETVRRVMSVNHGRSKISVSTMLGKGGSTMLGATTSEIAQPCWVMEAATAAPPVVDSSKTPGVGPAKANPVSISKSGSKPQAGGLRNHRKAVGS